MWCKTSSRHNLIYLLYWHWWRVDAVVPTNIAGGEAEHAKRRCENFVTVAITSVSLAAFPSEFMLRLTLIVVALSNDFVQICCGDSVEGDANEVPGE